MTKRNDDILFIYKGKAGEGFKPPTLKSIHSTAKKDIDGRIGETSVKKILDKERLIYRHRGKVTNVCQVNLSDSIKKLKK